MAACVLAIAAAMTPARAASGDALARDFPAGSIVTQPQADRALEAARELEAQSNRDWDAAQARCAAEFFVNRCIEAARRERNAALAQVRRVRVEANGVRRRLDAEQRAAELAERRAREAQLEAGKAAAGASGSVGPARTAEEIERARQKHAELEAAQKKRLAEEAARAPERAASAQRFEERQREAAAHARAKEQERADNEKRRAERAAARDKDAAERQQPPPPVRPPG